MSKARHIGAIAKNFGRKNIQIIAASSIIHPTIQNCFTELRYSGKKIKNKLQTLQRTTRSLKNGCTNL